MSADRIVLLEQHWQFLRARAVADEVAREREYQSATKKSELERFGFGRTQQLVPALVIPIWSVRGAIESYQLHPDKPRLNQKGKPRKYEMMSGSRMLLDVHPCLSRPREGGKVPLIAEPTIPLIVTEGIAKADSAISIGLCCIGLLGIWNWRGSNESGGKTALVDWESIALNGRAVYIAFDSDVMEKREVHAGLARLRAFLKSRKAIVKLIYLPPGDHTEKVGLDDFIAAQKAAGKNDTNIRDALLALATRELRKPTGGGDTEAGIYRETPNGLVRVNLLHDGSEVLVTLTNFTARIIADITRDDGAETTRSFEVDVKQRERTAVITIPIAQFPTMRWPVEALGSEAVVYAGQGTTDHTRCAIQLLSSGVARRTTYSHTGWRRIGDEWVYLHKDGAIGPTGAVEGIEVSLPPELAAFKLELPADPAALRRAVAASLRLLDLGPDRITVSVFGAVPRAILSGADFSIFLYGPTGVFKTEMAALAQQHFGAGFDARHLPTSFTSTANTNEAMAFTAKDAVLVVDELHPPASGTEREAMHRDAARLLRSQGNAAGRGRMRADGTLRASKPPRGMLVATGEELPRGQSVHARLFTLEILRGAIDVKKLTACQADAAAGLYAQATAAFIQWLAAHLDEARVEFEKLRREARSQFHHDHARTADIRAQLAAAYSIFIAFLVETEVIDASHAVPLQTRIGAALKEAATAQAQYAQSAEPTRAFVRLLGSALGSGAAHIADHDGGAPLSLEKGCGWRLLHIGVGTNERTDWQPQGSRIGWLDNDDLYLDRDAAYRVAQGMAADGVGIEVSATTLTRRLRDRGVLLSTDRNRDTLTVRLTLDGRRRDVLHLHAKTLGLSMSPQADQTDHDGGNGRVVARENGSFEQTRPQKN